MAQREEEALEDHLHQDIAPEYRALAPTLDRERVEQVAAVPRRAEAGGTKVVSRLRQPRGRSATARWTESSRGS